jgi:uncharacterized lipoprotein YmbA
MTRRCCGLLMLLVLCSCAMNAPLPADHYYKLPWQHATLPEIRLTESGIFVEQFIADGLYRERALLYTIDRLGIDLMQYHYHHWVDSPARMLRDQLIRYLTETRAGARVTGVPDAAALLGIHGTVKGFERREYGHTDQVHVELEFRVDRSGMDMPVLLADYQAQVEVTGTEMNDVVIAFEAALSQIFAHLLSDLNDRLVH